jgi:hypothetical protein
LPGVCHNSGELRGLLVATVLSAAALPSSLAAAQSAPTLHLAGRSPVTVVGSYFAPVERVRVTVSGLTTSTLAVRTTAAGSFRVAFPDVRFGRCAGFRVRAVGLRRGEVVMLKIPLPACLPARSP